MNFKNLFKLRGDLSSKDSLILSLVGVAILVVLWFGLAEFLAQRVITQDENIEISTLAVEKRVYYESDSLLIAEYDKLEQFSAEEIKSYGLKSNKVYPLLPSPVQVIKAFPDLKENDDVVTNTMYSIRFLFLFH